MFGNNLPGNVRAAGKGSSMMDRLRALLASGRSVLLEHELFDFFEAEGLPVPTRRFIGRAELEGGELELGNLVGRRGVLKVLSERVLHKSDMGAVCFIDAALPGAVREAGRRMVEALPPAVQDSVLGLILERAVSFTPGLGHELLLGVRRSPEHGAVFTLGFGGTGVEALAAAMRPDQATILFKPGLTTDERLAAKLDHALFFRWASGQVRGVRGASAPDLLRRAIERWVGALERLTRAVEACGHGVEELELNPLVWDAERRTWTPVDALLRLGPAPSPAPPFPVARLRRALRPERVAILGASARGMNVGRIILRSMLQGGFPPERIFPLHPDAELIDGIPCRRGLGELDGPVDLLVLAAAAPAVPAILEQALAAGTIAGAALLIPGGMGETEEGKAIEERIVEILGHQGEDRPVLIGNNSLGFISRPAAFDSLFIPREKLPRVEGGMGNVALISQSGAFMITALTKLDFLAPDYQISLGNQIDARVSHFVEALAGEPGLTTYGLYIEGLKPGDGERLAPQIRRLVEAGRDVVVYKAGRSQLGQKATMGHTASVAGDYRVMADLLADAGAMVAATFNDFLDLVRLSATLHGRPLAGRRVGLMSNAGYEAVGLADNHRGSGWWLEPAELSPRTVKRLNELLVAAKVQSLVTVKNPLDLTPMAGDRLHVECMEAILADPCVDLAVFGNVPLTAMVQSLPRGVSQDDVFDAPEGYANLTVELFRRTSKPFVVVIDGGRLYDAMADHLQRAGVPVFRTGDRAIRMLGSYAQGRRGGLRPTLR